MSNILDRIQFRTVATNGVELRVAITGEGPLVVMVHGWPESWYSWRHQMGPIADAGYQVAAIDVRGYGGSSKPHAVEAYDMECLTGDVAGLIPALGHDSAILIGHDWGAPIVWNTALLHPTRVSAVSGLSVPYLGPGPAPFIDIVKQVFTAKGRFFYQVYFQDEGVGEAELEADIRSGLRRVYYAISGDAPDGTWPTDKPHGATLLERLPDPDPFPAWLTETDIDYFVGEFERSGFRGPLNRYRNHQRDFTLLNAVPDKRIHQPALYIGGTRDLVLKMLPGKDMVASMKPLMPNLSDAVLLEGIGHWTQQEAPEQVTHLLLNWINSLKKQE